MSVLKWIFGERPSPLEIITHPPEGVEWRSAHPRAGVVVRAQLAGKDGVLRSARGRMRYRKNTDYIVDREGEHSVVSKDIFEKTYVRLDDGRWEKRTDIAYAYFTLPRTVTVATREGPQRADPGDWIIQGVEQELWPVARARAEQIYESSAFEAT
jgi:hypothetical protein